MSKKLLICSVAAWVVFGTVTVEAAPLTFDDPLFTGAGLAAYEPDGIGFVFDFDGFGDPTKPNYSLSFLGRPVSTRAGQGTLSISTDDSQEAGVEAGQISFGYDIAASEDKIFIHSRDIDASLSLDGLLGERLLLTLTSRQPGGLGPRPLADGFGDPENRDGDPSNDFVEVDFELATSPPPVPLPAAAWFMLTAVGALAGTRLLKGRAAEA